jgi:hypothetical protein
MKKSQILTICSLALILTSGNLLANRSGRHDVSALQNNALAASSPSYCSIKTLKGTYSYSVTGYDGNGPFAESGLETYDGKGNIAGLGSDTSDPNNAPFIGSYSLYGDCTGIADYGDNIIYNIYVKPDGSGFTFLDKTPGSILSGDEKRISKKLILK